MNILHDYRTKSWIAWLLFRQGNGEKRPHAKEIGKRDMLPLANRHLLRDVGLDKLAEADQEIKTVSL
ncbi:MULTISPECIES: hypothetical protein [unclassified Rhizobium]|uniref:hypothetical protein n=1 Tax=unclassified Rhizobium TaxID=2613769 RepID=UPI000DDF013C|nr:MULTISPECIES: hypothetical protein [unclassified Rhizobium]MBB3291263.1 hypothetical protein [Rhizobium sp. BK252]MBB3406001.1 hypothetical protein [Rhizobium sp. BK289]MBB3418590.1 hypothetical protein [Rhizobium sp. BK284]MBB3486465.1 hypothetical protein [Rhizobium sp. BK347]